MPQHISYDEERIETLVFQKQANEIELAWELLYQFDHAESLINPLRQLASFAVDEMLELRPNNLEERKAIMAAWNKEKRSQDTIKRPSWKSPRQWKDPKEGFGDPWSFLRSVSNNILTLRASECSDVIRLYGEVVEQGAKVRMAMPAYHNPMLPRKKSVLDKFTALDEAKEDYRKGGNEVWQEGRKRIKRPGKQIPKGPARDMLLAQEGGIWVWALMDSSTVLKIDRTFGVVEGADISGTTTDTIFFLDRFIGLFKQQMPSMVGQLEDPIYQLLPLATIVAGGHHSLLEVALAQSINGVNHYSIGLYTTLMPDSSTHPARGQILNLLHRAENNVRNRLMVLYYRQPGVLGGCYLFAKQGRERMDFQKLALADLKMLNIFAATKPYPNQTDVIDLMQKRTQRMPAALGLS